MPLKECSKCSKLIPLGKPYCESCKRPSAAARGYGYRWKRYRLEYLAAHPFCVVCGKPATDVDHIDGNSRNNNASNHQSMCHGCHAAKTCRENGGFGNA